MAATDPHAAKLQKARVDELVHTYEALIARTMALILEAGFDGPDEQIRLAAEDLIDCNSGRFYDLLSVASYYGLYT